MYFRTGPALGITCASWRINGEGGYNYIKLVDQIVKGRMNRKCLCERIADFWFYPTAIPENGISSRIKNNNGLFYSFAEPFFERTHISCCKL